MKNEKGIEKNEGEWGDGGCIYLMGKRKQKEFIEKNDKIGVKLIA